MPPQSNALEDWEADGQSKPHGEYREFILAAQETLLPELTKLANILEGADFQCEAYRSDD